MKDAIIVKRYAQAYVEYATDGVGLERIVKEFKDLKVILRSNSDLEKFLYNPQISYADKCDTVNSILKEYFSEPLRSLLKLLIEHGRIKHIIDICDYVRVMYSHGEAVEALLKTCYPLDIKSIQQIKKKLEEKLNKKMHLVLELDPSLLGGVQIQIGNTVIDGSVRRKLDELRQKLMTVEVA